MGVADRRHPRSYAVCPHDPGYPVLAHAAALTIERPVHARTAIGAVAVTVNLLNLLAQHRIGLCPLARLTMPPAIVAGTRHAIHPAHQRHLVFGPVCFDELEDFRF